MIKRRHILSNIEAHIHQKQYSIITGARQIGKTSLLRLIFQNLSAQNKVVYYLNFEDQRILNAINKHPEGIFQFIKETPKPIIEGQNAHTTYLLLDEIQYATDPTYFLKYLYDTYESNLKIIATGSSAFYIDRKFKDSLAGRKRIFQLHPLTFEEYLFFKNEQQLIEEFKYLKEKTSYQSLHREAIKLHFHEYLNYGGYPAVVLENDVNEKKLLLEELKNAYIKRDLLESGVERETNFFLLLQILADQVGNLVNKQELGKTIQLDSKTVENYLYILQKCYHIYLIRPFFKNIRKELTKMPKVFFNDLGLRNSFLNRFGRIPERTDKGSLLENYFFLELRKSYSLDQIKFWRTADRHEVDFIIEESFGQGKAYEVKWNETSYKAHKYKKFIESYPDYPLSCISSDNFHII